MTLALRVIASLLFDPQRGAIKGERFQHDRVVGDPINWARVMAQVRQVDELIMLDVSGNPPDYMTIGRIAAECFIPLSYGGGITTAQAALDIIKLGCDKLVFTKYDLIPVVARTAGSQAVVFCVNYEDGEREQCTTRAIRAVEVGAGEILLQSRERDGMLCGYDIEQLAAVRAVVNVPVTISSGASCGADFVAAARAGADGMAAGAVWQFTDLVPNDVKRALADASFPVRLVVAA